MRKSQEEQIQEEKHKDDLVYAGAIEGTPGEAELKSDLSSAEEALKRHDAAELYRLYEKAIKHRGDLLAALNAVAAHYLGDKNIPRYETPSNAVDAMEHVALAAIDLAKSITSGSKA